jgi:MFS family permease
METIKTRQGRQDTAPESAEHSGHPRRRAILAVMCLSLLIVVIDNTILNTALPTLARVLHASTTNLQWITDAYTLAFAALLIMAGALGDRFGRRTALIVGLVVFATGSTWAALSGDTSTLIAARVVMGVGAAFVMPATLSILTAVFPARARRRDRRLVGNRRSGHRGRPDAWRLPARPLLLGLGVLGQRAARGRCARCRCHRGAPPCWPP